MVQQESSGKNYNEVDVDYYDESFQNETILPENPYQEVKTTQRNPLEQSEAE